MAIKDFEVKENDDRNKEADKDWKSHHTTTGRYPEEAKGIAETEVKNAHATGDGSFGRNDESLPEEAKDEEKKDNNY